jgi:hypothetical protein
MTFAPPPEGLIERLTEWFTKQGYPLEFETARNFRRRNWLASQGVYYTDTASSQAREIDVVANVETPGRHPFVRIAIECKVLEDPIVVLVADQPEDQRVDLGWMPSTRGVAAMNAKLSSVGELPHLLRADRPGDLIGYSVVRGFRHDVDEVTNKRKDVDTAYTAISSLVGAAEAIAQDFVWGHAGIVWPVLVIDGNLVRATIDLAGEPKLEAVQWHRVLWRGSTRRPDPTLVDIVTRQLLVGWPAEMRNAVEFLEAQFGSFVSSAPVNPYGDT